MNGKSSSFERKPNNATCEIDATDQDDDDDNATDKSDSEEPQMSPIQTLRSVFKEEHFSRFFLVQ